MQDLLLSVDFVENWRENRALMKKQKALLGQVDFIICTYHKNLTKLFEWPDSVGQAEEPLGHLHSGEEELKVMGSRLGPVQC